MKGQTTVRLCDIQGRKIKQYRLENAGTPLQTAVPNAEYTVCIPYDFDLRNGFAR